MSSIYPNAIDGQAQLPKAVDGVTAINADTINRLRSAIINIETELGVNPSGDSSSVKIKLNELSSQISSINVGTLEEDIASLESKLNSLVDDISVAGSGSVTSGLVLTSDGLGGTSWKPAASPLPTSTKGDLIVHNGTTEVRLPVGTDNFVLTADSTEASGVKWSAVSSSVSKLDDLTDVDTTTTAPTDGQALVYDADNSLWIPGDVASGSGGSVSVWSAQQPPASANALDYERGAGMAMFTTYDPDGILTVSEEAYGIKLAHTSPAVVTGTHGIIQEVPAGEFSVTFYVAHAGIDADWSAAGAILAGDIVTNPTTAPMLRMGVGFEKADTVMFLFQSLANYGTFSVNYVQRRIANPGVYVRLSVDETHTLVAVAHSYDGQSWLMVDSDRSIPFTPAYMGPALSSHPSGTEARFPFWRVREGAGQYKSLEPEGGFVTVG